MNEELPSATYTAPDWAVGHVETVVQVREPAFPWRDAAWLWLGFAALGIILGVAFTVLTGY